MVRNGHSVILFPNWLLSNITYGTKWLWCKIHMLRNGSWLWYKIAILWYEMVMVQNTYGTKWFLVMVRNCNIVVRNGYGTKWLASSPTIHYLRNICCTFVLNGNSHCHWGHNDSYTENVRQVHNSKYCDTMVPWYIV